MSNLKRTYAENQISNVDDRKSVKCLECIPNDTESMSLMHLFNYKNINLNN